MHQRFSTLVPSIYYIMVSTQEMNLLPENSSQNSAILAQSQFRLIQHHLAMLKFIWLHNHHSIYMYRVWLSAHIVHNTLQNMVM